jgi:hypothetical protein
LKGKAFVGCALLAVGALAAGCGGLRAMDKDVKNAIALADLQARADELGPRFEKLDREIVVAIKKGDTLPLAIAFDAPAIATLESGENRVTFTRDLYLAISKDGAFLSGDGETWARVGDAKALQQLFGYEHGAVQAGFSATKDKGPAVTVGLSLR